MTDINAPRARARKLAAEAAAVGDPTGWFETLYQEAARGESIVPWADLAPNPLLVEWAESHDLQGSGRSALVVGCGLGDDAEYLAERGFRTTAFDISPTAIDGARSRFPDSPVDYTPADLLQPPADWLGAFDFVLEIYTVQPLYGPARKAALEVLPRLVAPNGSLLLIARATEDPDPPRDPELMPWALTRAELDTAADGLTPTEIELFHDREDPPVLRWRAHLHRPAHPTDPPSQQIVARYFEMWNTGDTSMVHEILSPDWVDHAHPEVTGPQSVRQAVEQIRAARPDLRFRIDAILGDGDLVAVTGSVVTGSVVTGPQEAAPTSNLVWLIHLKNGQMAEMRTYRDTTK